MGKKKTEKRKRTGQESHYARHGLRRKAGRGGVRGHRLSVGKAGIHLPVVGARQGDSAVAGGSGVPAVHSAQTGHLGVKTKIAGYRLLVFGLL